MGAVDSPNLYAFVGWHPHLAADPLGLAEALGARRPCSLAEVGCDPQTATIPVDYSAPVPPRPVAFSVPDVDSEPAVSG